MRRPLTLAMSAATLVVGAPAVAQIQAPVSDGGAAGLRYLSWPGKPDRPVAVPVAASSTAPAEAASAPVLTAEAPMRPTVVDRPPVIPRGGYNAGAAAPAWSTPVSTPGQGLTPASAWMSPHAPAYAASAPVETASAPVPYVAAAPAPPPPARIEPAPPAPVMRPAAPAAASAPALVTAAPVERAPPPPPPPPEPIPAALPPEAPAEPPFDPMAPRRDAPIFRLQRPQAPVQAPVQAPAEPASAELQPAPAAAASGGSRYYSVHRQAGRQPDAAPTPTPIYLDALPVDLDRAPSSTDLAEPPPAPNLIRNANGRVQALVPNSDPTLP